MLNGVKVSSKHLLNILKMKINNKINGDKIIFYIFKVLNAHIPRHNFYIKKLNQCFRETPFSIFQENIS
jgi:hypothetical protein